MTLWRKVRLASVKFAAGREIPGKVTMAMSAAGPRDCPVITTERLTLRPHLLADFEDSLAMWADPAVVRYVGGEPSSPEEAWSRLLRYAGLWAPSRLRILAPARNGFRPVCRRSRSRGFQEGDRPRSGRIA